MAMSRPMRRRSRQKSDKPDPIDVQVGSRVRLRRNMLGLSQEKLGVATGLTFQQVQKYERGANRIGASRLHELSRALDVPVMFFFDDMDPVRAPAIPGGFSEPPAEASDSDPLRRRETIELVDAYYEIKDSGMRRHLLELARMLAGEPSRTKGAARSENSVRGRGRRVGDAVPTNPARDEDAAGGSTERAGMVECARPMVGGSTATDSEL
jgi:transcriptional regulator with XRE-family HTH domain